MALLPISPYISWKGLSTNSAVPSNSRPDLNASGPQFKAQPINHWRKQLIPNANSGGRTRRAGIGMPMDTPGGSVYLGNVSANTNCLLNNTADATGIKENIVKVNDTSFTKNDNGCLSNTCNPEKNRINSATTIVSKTYYKDSRAYLRARNQLYDQKLTALPVSTITYLDESNNLLYPTDSPNGPQVRQTENCPTGTTCQTIYKPNNTQYSQQGAVDSSSRIARLKLNTINKNAASYKEVFGTTASKYTGASSTPYFLKSKYQVCVPMSATGKKVTCPA